MSISSQRSQQHGRRRANTSPLRRRLRVVATALRSLAPAVGEISETLKPLPLDVDGGGVAQWKLEQILNKRDGALESKDYRLASELDDLHTILTPVSPSERQVFESYPDLTSTVEEQAQFFYRFGFCVLPRVFAGDHLRQLREAWRRRQRPAVEKRNASYFESTGLQRRIDATFIDVPTKDLFAGLVEQLEEGQKLDDAVLLDLIDPPRLIALLTRIFVTDQWTELRMPGLLQARTFPARDDPEGDGRGYIGWYVLVCRLQASILCISHGGVYRSQASRPRRPRPRRFR